MKTRIDYPTVSFPEAIDASDEARLRDRGSVQVTVRAKNGVEFYVTFVTIECLQRGLAQLNMDVCPFLAEPNSVIVPEITVQTIKRSVEVLWREGYFRRFMVPGVSPIGFIKWSWARFAWIYIH